MKLKIAFAMAVVAFGGSGRAMADFMDQTLTAEWLYPSFDSVLESHKVVVGKGVELGPEDIIFDNNISIDIAGTTITFEFNSDGFWQNTSFNGWRFIDTNGTIPDIVGYEVTAVSDGMRNLDQVVTGFDADSVWADFGGLEHLNETDFITLTVTFVICPADFDNSGDVGVKDLLILLGTWGPCKGCPADFDDSGDVGVKDLLVLLGAWGPCPK